MTVWKWACPLASPWHVGRGGGRVGGARIAASPQESPADRRWRRHHARRPAVRLRPRRHRRRAARHPERLRHRHHARRGHHELGHARRTVRRARRRRARRRAGPAHHDHDGGRAVHRRRRARGVRAGTARARDRATDRRVRRRRGIGGGASVRLGDGARPPSWSVRVDVPAGDHHRHLHRLRRRSGLDQQRRVAGDARRLGHSRTPARPGDLADAGVTSLADPARARRRVQARVAEICTCIAADASSASWREVLARPCARR